MQRHPGTAAATVSLSRRHPGIAHHSPPFTPARPVRRTARYPVSTQSPPLFRPSWGGLLTTNSLPPATPTPSPVSLQSSQSSKLDRDRDRRTRTPDWQIWTAGIATSNSVRDQFVSAVKAYAADAKNKVPLGDLYESKDGTWVPNTGRARPVAGGHLALVRVACFDV